MFFTGDEAIKHEDDLPKKLVTLCNLASTTPRTFLGSTRRELEGELQKALRAEAEGEPMPDTPARQHCLRRELRLVIKPAYSRLRRIDLEIQQLNAERNTLSALLQGSR